MMKSFIIKIGRRNKDWDTYLSAQITDKTITFVEQLQNIDSHESLNGRKLFVINSSAFKNVIASETTDLELFMQKKSDDNRLNIDYLHRLCERHRIRYDLTGERLSTAYRKYRKYLSDTKDERMAKGAKLYAKAIGNMLTFDTDKFLIEDLLNQAINLGFNPAYRLLAEFYHRENNIVKAEETASKGVKAGDPYAMIALAYLLSESIHHKLSSVEKIKPDFNRAAELYIEGAVNGALKEGISGLSRLINEGVYTPKSNLYMKLICLSAKAKRNEQDENDTDFSKDKDIREALNFLFHSPVDTREAIKLLIKAVEDGKTEAYDYLVTAYRHSKKFGKAIEAAIAGVKNGNKQCYLHIAHLYNLGADFTYKTDKLGQPDYQNAVKWAVRSIEEGVTEASKLLMRYLTKGLKVNGHF